MIIFIVAVIGLVVGAVGTFFVMSSLIQSLQHELINAEENLQSALSNALDTQNKLKHHKSQMDTLENKIDQAVKSHQELQAAYTRSRQEISQHSLKVADMNRRHREEMEKVQGDRKQKYLEAAQKNHEISCLQQDVYNLKHKLAEVQVQGERNVS